MPKSSSPPPAELPDHFGRQACEFITCLSLAVVLFKTFLIEGYVVTTGSMSPALLGRHKQVVCPSCQFRFAVGTSQGHSPHSAVCPNCDQSEIPLDTVLQNEGDQLLVNKSAYQMSQPQRWQAAVFRNPATPVVPYVKRLVGLPGEEVELYRGEAYINGQLARKSYRMQRYIRMLIHDADFVPVGGDPDWQPRWVGTQPWWQPRGTGFACDTRPEKGMRAEWAWLTYRHWLRSGGVHGTTVSLPDWPPGVPLPRRGIDPFEYDPSAGALRSRGVVSAAARDQWLARSSEKSWKRALEQLYTFSHMAPVTDFYAYNRGNHTAREEFVVRDLCLSFDVQYKTGQGEIRCDLFDGHQPFSLILDAKRREARLEQGEGRPALRKTLLPDRFFTDSVTVEFSNIDQQIVCAISGQPLFEPFEFERPDPPGGYPRQPVRIGARDLRVHVSHLKVYRDVYYTPEGTTRKWKLKNSPGLREYLALGDNSPISVDSRVWPREQFLEQQLLIGKPFVVHLPAQTKVIGWGAWQARLRVPDFSRMRYIQ